MKFEIKTTPYESGIIEQELLPEDNNIGFGYTKWVVDTREQGIKEALIALGWKPPNTHIHMDAALCGECTKIGRNGEHSWHCRKCGKELHQ